MSQKDICVSVIIPIYNAEQYLEKCFKAIESQSMESFEVIMVNNNATDSSEKICKRWEMKDHRFRYCFEEIKGISYARNTGLKIAEGKYVLFADADDLMHEDMLEKLFWTAEEADAEVAICSYNYIYGRKVKKNKRYIETGIYNKSQILNEILKDPFDFYYAVTWNKMIRKDLLNNEMILFDPEETVIEDWEFSLCVFAVAEKVGIISERLYDYNRSNNSSATKNERTFQDSKRTRLRGYEYFKSYAENIDLYQKNRNEIDDYILRYIVFQKYKAGFNLEMKKEAERIAGEKDIQLILNGMERSFYFKRNILYHIKYGSEMLVRNMRMLIKDRR